MPRTTRAAARAKDTEIEIATDNTQTEALDHTSDAEPHAERPALVEMTANAVEEVELAIALKDETRSPKKAAMSSARKKATKRGKTMAKGRKTVKKAHVAEPTALMGSESESAVELAEESAGKGSDDDMSEAIKEPLVDEPMPASPAQEAPVKEMQPQTEAITKLEGLFEQPGEAKTGNAVEEIAAAATIASSDPQDVAELPVTEPKNTVQASKTQIKSGTYGATKLTTKVIKDRKHSLPARRPSTMVNKPIAKPSSGSAGPKDKASNAANGLKSPEKERTGTVKKPTAITSLKTPPRLAKSTKPPTTSTFKLTGDGLAEKFKAQREERQKRQQEQAEKQKAAAPRPTIPQKHTTKPRAVPEVKSTKAAATRMSMSSTLKERPNGARPMANKSAATLRASHRPSLSVSSGNMTKPMRAPAHARAASVTTSKDMPQATVTMTAAQKQEAAKKARAEAAERGRAASKAWAEKKKVAETAKKPQTTANSDVEAKENSDPAGGAVQAQ